MGDDTKKLAKFYEYPSALIIIKTIIYKVYDILNRVNLCHNFHENHAD